MWGPCGVYMWGRRVTGGQLSKRSHRPVASVKVLWPSGTQVLVQRTPRAQVLTTRQVSQHLGKAFPSTPRSQGPGRVNMGEK